MLWIPSMMCMLGSFPFFGVLITDEVGHMSLNCMPFDLDWYDSIVAGWYLKPDLTIETFAFCSQFLVYVRNLTLLLYVAIVFSVPDIG